MKIRKEKDNLKIEFEYNPVLIQRVRLFPNRKYDADEKAWYVPLAHTKEVIDVLAPEGFQMSYEVKEIYEAKEKEANKINRVLNGSFKSSEEELIEKTNLPFFDFQKKGVAFLTVVRSGLLGDEPGLGKTLQSLGSSLITETEITLVLCPSTLKFQWQEEIEKWLPNKTSIVIDGTKKQREEQWKQNKNFFIANYELLIRDLDLIKNKNWDLLISDESTRISNPRTKQSKLIKKIKAKRRIAMTGTPLNNTVNDLWNIIDFCQPGSLGSYWQFTERYCIKDRWGSVIGYKNLPELKKKLHSLMIRRTKSEVLEELPDKLYETIYINLEPEERQIYDAIKNEITTELKEYCIDKVLQDKYLSSAIVKMIRLRQTACSLELVSQHKQSPKLEALKELLGDIMHGKEKAIIFSEFKEMTKIIHSNLSNYNALLYTGDTSKEEREEIVKKFNNDEKYKILVMSPAGGFGLNLQRANYIIHYDLPWSLAKVEQREGRAHRIGQKNKLTIFKLVVKNTIDEYIIKILHKKQKISDDLLEKKKTKRIKLTKDDIKNILSSY